MSNELQIPEPHDQIIATQLPSQSLNPEQKHYLEGFFAGMQAQGVSFAAVGAATIASVKIEDEIPLIFEERVKREEHPLDSYYRLTENAAFNKAPDKEETFRFKWNGLFYLTPVKEAFMARLRIPGGQLRSFQLREIAQIAKQLTSGYVQITTRANFQIRLIEPKNAPEVLRRVQSVGLHTRGAGADNIRNITANPTAGVDPHELIDVTPYCNDLAQFILSHREFYDLPRKFNIALDGGGLIGSVEDTNDIGVRAVRVRENVEGIVPGIYFRMKLGGATGHKAFARDIGVLIAPDQVVKVILSAVRVFIANGNRTDRKKARLKHLLDTWTLDRYLDEIEKLLASPLVRAPLDASGESSVHDSEVATTIPHSHIGAFPQKQKGFQYIGVAIPVGQISPDQLLRLADLADNYGSGEIRLTVWQNLVLPHVPDAYVETVKKALVKMGFHWKQSNLSSGVVACTGNVYCKYAATNTKAHALEIMRKLEKRVTLDQPINIHVTGCPHSCAQHYMGDIGLLGAKVTRAGESVEGYHIFVGGGFATNRAIGRQVFQGIPFDETIDLLEKMLKTYLQNRSGSESFQHFTARHDLNALQVLFSQDV